MVGTFVEENWNVGGSAILVRKALLQGGCALHLEGTPHPRQVRGQLDDDRQCALGPLLHTQGTSKQASHYSHPLI